MSIASQKTTRGLGSALFSARWPGWAVPLGLFLLAVLGYGIHCATLGLFGNDWPYVWYYHLFGPTGPTFFANMDRPYSGWFYILSSAILGEQVWAYHLFMLLLRWGSGVLAWWIFRMVWPEQPRPVALVAALFVLYPGFRQQPVSVEFILHFAILDLQLLSVGLLLWVLARPRYFWPVLIVSLALSLSLFSLEYFIGIEVLRPVLVWMVLRRSMDWKKALRKTVLIWLPFVAMVLVFAFWRVVIFKFPTYQPVLMSGLTSDPVGTGLTLAKKILRDLRTVTLGAWRQVLSLPSDARTLLPYLLLVAASFGVGLALWKGLERETPPASARLSTDRWALEALALGLLCLLAFGWSMWIPNLAVETSFPWDRSTLPFMLGVSLLVVGGVLLLIQARWQGLVLALLVGLAVGLQYQNANQYLFEWEKLRSYFWQLTWRAPALQAGTIVVSEQIPLDRYSDNDLTAVLNWTYAPEHHTHSVPYRFVDLSLRLGSEFEGLPALKEGLPVSFLHRSIEFKGNTSNLLVIYSNAKSCLRVLGPEDAVLPNLPNGVIKALPVSHVQQIQKTQSPAQPPAVMGSEPAHDWCYTFQKADLARQMKDWNEVTRLGDQAMQAGLQAKDRGEWMAFVEGYAYTGKMEMARKLNDQANQPGMTPALCTLWGRVEKSAELSPADRATAKAVRSDMGCTP